MSVHYIKSPIFLGTVLPVKILRPGYARLHLFDHNLALRLAYIVRRIRPNNCQVSELIFELFKVFRTNDNFE